MTNPITLIRRGWLLFQIRSLETTIDGQTDALHWKTRLATKNSNRACARPSSSA